MWHSISGCRGYWYALHPRAYARGFVCGLKNEKPDPISRIVILAPIESRDTFMQSGTGSLTIPDNTLIGFDLSLEGVLKAEEFLLGDTRLLVAHDDPRTPRRRPHIHHDGTYIGTTPRG